MRADPVTNDLRAAWAMNAVEVFRAEVCPDEDDETAIGDLLANMVHLMRQLKLDEKVMFSKAVECADEEEALEAQEGV